MRRVEWSQEEAASDVARLEAALQRAEDQLRQTQKMDALGRLAGGVAHDFNNVLTVIQSFAGMLEETLDRSDPTVEDAIAIRRAAERGAELTRQLLAMSRESVAAPRAVLLDDLVAAFVPMLRRLLGPQITLVRHRSSLRSVIVDPGQMEQVLMNLVVNARDAMPDGGRLTIETRELELDEQTASRRGVVPGQYVELAVTDTGTGIPREIQDKLFEAFFTTKSAGKGTGLGLSIVQEIVRAAHGAITVYSEVGHGTTFSVYLPVSAEQVVIGRAEPAPVTETLAALVVLVADDDAAIRAVATRILANAGCRVLEASNAEEARRICVGHETPIDVAVIDTVLSDGRAEILVHQLRELRPTLQIVQMSGFPAGALAVDGTPPVDLLVKPFSPAELRTAVARAVAPSESLEAPARAAASSIVPNRRVLLVDDDEVLRRAMVRMLRREGFEVTDVDNGRKAIGELDKRRFDVIVSDVQMPECDGLELLRAVRRVDLDVPVILISGAPDLTSAQQAVEYGAFRYLTKPLDASFASTVTIAARAHALARLRREASVIAHGPARAVDRAGLEVRFEQAIASLWMAYQPIVHAATGVRFGVEALMRTHESSMPTPASVLEAATQLGRLPIVGRRVRELAARAFAGTLDGTLFINLHPEDLLDADLVSPAASLTALASRVVLEITERASLDNVPQLAERVARLRALGFRIAVDDIGAGYSGLSSFTELAPEIVKIDMGLVRDVHQSRLKQRTIGALCRLCHEVETLVVAEGVETEEERTCLIDLGCDLLQGFLIERPGPGPI